MSLWKEKGCRQGKLCSESEGWQSFTNETWARRQEEKKYSLMSCETIIAQLDVLKLL